MVVRVLAGASGFGGIDYNEEKVKKGDAHIVEMKNISGLAALPEHSADDLKEFFTEYSGSNTNIQKPQFHVAFSVKGTQMTHEEIADVARKWMVEMGYAGEGQPMVIYAHHDTGNNHIHVITSRVDPSGKKINHHNEKYRSRIVLDKILGIKHDKNVGEDVIQMLSNYQFDSLNQFKAIYESMGYEATEENDTVAFKKDGEVKASLPVAEVNKILAQKSKDEDAEDVTTQRKKAWRAKQLLLKLAKNSSNRDELAAAARKKFGLGIVWLGKADSPYGYILVDHKNKMVFNGSKVCKLKELTEQFVSVEKRMEETASILKKALADTPGIVTRDLNYLLAKETGGKISKGTVSVGSLTADLDAEVKQRLKDNDRISWVNSFCPTNEVERDLLCKLTGIKDEEKEHINISEERKEPDEKMLEQMKDAYEKSLTSNEKWQKNKSDLRIAWREGVCYCLDFKNAMIVNLNEKGIASIEEIKNRAESLIWESMKQKPDITTRQLNYILVKNIGCRIRKGILRVIDEEVPLPPDFKKQLKENDKVAWATSFSPTTEQERDLICRVLGVDPERVELAEERKAPNQDTLSFVSEIYASFPKDDLQNAMERLGLMIRLQDGRWYCIDTKTSTMFDLKLYGYDTSMFIHFYRSHVHEKPDMNPRSLASRLNGVGGGKGQKRDWEVDRAREYSDDDESQSQGRSM